MAHFVVFIAKKSTRFRVMVREYLSTTFATCGSPSPRAGRREEIRRMHHLTSSLPT